jgi:uncharacterized membrane protein YvbJ
MVSGKAKSCPNCGIPIADIPDTMVTRGHLNTIQETSKKFKLQSLLSTVLIILGVIWMFIATKETKTVSSLVTLVGIVWFITNKFRVWWHHK